MGTGSARAGPHRAERRAQGCRVGTSAAARAARRRLPRTYLRGRHDEDLARAVPVSARRHEKTLIGTVLEMSFHNPPAGAGSIAGTTLRVRRPLAIRKTRRNFSRTVVLCKFTCAYGR
ncbi:hypothetical protein GCM10010285_63860 [Streptomyces pseudogriseolus]|uniref:Uncharacterized protein n=1 Tax=Streptomyces pseudogriseolus TaxID=36817 RepID=A0ABQ2TM40_STREZ|nr:hypothetical protein GCM10010285_63860 [Streptomyces rubiginosus]